MLLVKKINIQVGNGQVAAHRFGEGEKLLIAIHGYGDSQKDMAAFATAFATQNYTVYTFDLPLHGEKTAENSWQTAVFKAEDTAELIEHIQRNEPQCRSLELAGYSLGGRVLLAALPFLTQKPRVLYLLASAGAPQNLFQPYIKVPILLKKLLRKMTENPIFILKLAYFCAKIRIISSFQLAFCEKYFGDESLRKKMFFWWESLHFLPVKKHQIQDIIVFNGVQVYGLFGRKDVVLPRNSDIWFQKSINFTAFDYIERGHRGVQQAAATWAKRFF